MKSSNDCLHPLLPPDRTLNQVLRTRAWGHSFQLPTCSFNFHKKSFVISCLFKFLTWVCSCLVCVVFFIFDFFFKCFSNFLLSRLTFCFNLIHYYYVLLTIVTFTKLIYYYMHVCCCYSINCIVLYCKLQTQKYARPKTTRCRLSLERVDSVNTRNLAIANRSHSSS